MSGNKNSRAVVLKVRVLTGVGGSDHLPVEATIEFAAVETGLTLGRPRPERTGMAGETGTKVRVKTRVLVTRHELTGVAADESRLWIPVTVEIVIGQLVLQAACPLHGRRQFVVRLCFHALGTESPDLITPVDRYYAVVTIL
jgi:hypothetical protein